MYENIFKLNPQLRSIQIRDIDNVDILREASQNLHHLESIELINIERNILASDNVEKIRFTNVKRFDIEIYDSEGVDPIFIPLEFDQLEEMIFDCSYPKTTKWIEFIEKQQKLKTLAVLDIRFTSQEWMSISEHLPQLEVIKISWNSEFGNYGIVNLMAAKTNLKKIVFVRISEEQYNDFKDSIDPQWQFQGAVQPYMKEATFIRRENNS